MKKCIDRCYVSSRFAQAIITGDFASLTANEEFLLAEWYDYYKAEHDKVEVQLLFCDEADYAAKCSITKSIDFCFKAKIIAST